MEQYKDTTSRSIWRQQTNIRAAVRQKEKKKQRIRITLIKSER